MKKGWEVKKLGDISHITYGYTAKSSMDKNEYHYLRITDIQDGFVDWHSVPFCNCSKEDINRYALQDGDIVFARTGATTGKSFLLKGHFPKALFASYLIRLRLIDKYSILPAFIRFFFDTFEYWKIINNGIIGAAQGGFNATKLSQLQISIPPLSEQQRIVKILDTAFAKIDTIKRNAERNLQNAKELFQSLLKKELNGKNKWPVTKIIEVCTLKSGNSLSQTLFSEKGEIPYIKVAEMNLVENIPQITSSPYMVKRKNVLKAIFPKGSIIFPKRGGAIATNKKRITNVEICADLNIMGIIPNNTIKSEYLYYYFLNVDLGKLSNGTTIPQINNGDIAPLKIFLPPLSEQEQIVTKLDALSIKCKELENNYRQTITDCDEMKKSILAKAFNGEL